MARTAIIPSITGAGEYVNVSIGIFFLHKLSVLWNARTNAQDDTPHV